MARDSNIYGADDNDFAQGIASDALTNTAGRENVWGGGREQDARSKGNTTEPENPDTKVIGDKSDGRAKSKGN